MSKLRRLRVYLALAATVAALMLGAVALSPAEAKPSNILLRGHIDLVSGKPATGIEIDTIVRMPAHLRRDAPSEVNLPYAARTTAVSSGAFSLAVDPVAVPDAYVDDDGSVPMTIIVRRGSEVLGVHNFNVYKPTTRGGPWLAEKGQAGGPDVVGLAPRSMSLEFSVDDIGFRSGGLKVERSLVTGPELELDLVRPNKFDRREVEPVENAPLGCIEVDQGEVGRYNTILQTAGTNSRYVTYDFEFNQNSSETDSIQLGIGFSSSGNSGSFSSGGKTKFSTSTKISYGTQTSGHKHYYTKTVYNKYIISCSTGGIIPFVFYEIRPVWITGDAWTSTVSSRNYTHCTRIGPGITVERQTGSTIWYNDGVKAGVMGSSLEVKNDLEKGDSHRVKFKNTANRTDKWVCGQYAVLGSPSRTGRLTGDFGNR
jgi:hypothetical protein